MPPTLFNQDSTLIENYKGHIEIFDSGVDPDTWFKPDMLLDWSVATIVDTEKHYSTNGKKKKTIIGNSSVYQFKLENSADLYEKAATPVEEKTISFWKSQIYAIPPKLPHITLRGVSESNAASDKFVIDTFVATVENIDEERNENEGTGKIIVSGEIISHTSNVRASSAP
jgi:hypothetical protein